MAAQKFVYTVSGVALSEAQKAAISREIAIAVTRVLIGSGPSLIESDYQGLHPVCGGSHKRRDPDPKDSESNGVCEVGASEPVDLPQRADEVPDSP